MNVADSQRVASALEHLGYQQTPAAETADIIVMNTCVVRQSAEDKAYGRLTSLRPLKKHKPDLVINLMGCLVGVKDNTHLRERFPYVDVFSPPSDPAPLVNYLLQKEGRQLEEDQTAERFAWMDGDLVLPKQERNQAGFGVHPGGLRLFVCLHVLHHPLPARCGTFASGG